MSVLIAIAFKSLLVAGLTLALLALMKRRSAAERSWVAHIGLFALVVMALAPLALPPWQVETPAIFSPAPIVQPATQALVPARAGHPDEAPRPGRNAPSPGLRPIPRHCVLH